jgi:hypothetical protein
VREAARESTCGTGPQQEEVELFSYRRLFGPPEGRRVVEGINTGRRRLLDVPSPGWSKSDQAALASLTRRLSDAKFALIDAQDASPDK